MTRPLRIAVVAPVAWRTPPRAYGPWELVAHNLTEGLVAAGHDVTLFATADSLTSARLESAVARGYEDDRSQDAKVCEYLHLAHAMERAGEFDLVHNHFDFMGLAYSRLIAAPMVTTIHGFSSERIVPVYRRYDGHVAYVSISDADRHPDLTYAATVYNGIDAGDFRFGDSPGEHLLYFGRMHPDKGPHEAIEIARRAGRRLVMAGLIQDAGYWERTCLPHVDGERVVYLGNVGPAERRRVLAGAAALLHPIHFDEPFGLSVAESMISGTPVIAYDRGAMPELIERGVGGFRVRGVEEAVAACGKIGDVDRAECRRSALRRFSREAMTEGYERVYEGVLARRRGVSR